MRSTLALIRENSERIMKIKADKTPISNSLSFLSPVDLGQPSILKIIMNPIKAIKIERISDFVNLLMFQPSIQFILVKKFS